MPLFSRTPRLAVFDETHGQLHWGQTGFPPRRMITNFAGLAQVLARHGLRCGSIGETPVAAALAPDSLLVIPPPAGIYDADAECWRRDETSLFTPDEVEGLVSFVRGGGSLLAFSYRFGDAFTRTNLGKLISAFGCELNADVVVDFSRLKATQALAAQFECNAGSLMTPWPATGVRALHWRCMATLGIRPGTRAIPLVLSPSVRCLSYHYGHRQITFQLLPLAVAGTLGAGRFAFFGGPHGFETGPLGLLHAADNLRLLHQLTDWLLERNYRDHPERLPPMTTEEWLWHPFEPRTNPAGAWPTVEFVEQMLRESEILHALPVEKWSV